MQDKVDAATYFGGRNSIDKAYPAHHPMREFLCEGKGGTTSVESYDLIIQKGGGIGAQWLARAKEELAQINNCSMTDVIDAAMKYVDAGYGGRARPPGAPQSKPSENTL